MNKVFVLLAVYQLKHFLSDFPLQTEYMLGKFREKDWAEPLAQHCAVHGLMTFVICSLALINKSDGLAISVLLMLLDFTIHFAMDRIKASPHMLGRFKGLGSREFPLASVEAKKSNRMFWNCIGIDQAVHHLTHYAIIWILVKL